MADAMTTSSLAPHADHDLLLVAEAADRGGELPPTLDTCPDCRTLHGELVTLAAAVPTAALPSRPRTYTLTQADADRLRPSGWRRWLGAVGTSRDAFTRPLALGFTTIGLAGLLVATVPGALPSGGATGAAQERSESVQGAAPTAPSGPTDLMGAPDDGASTVGGTESTFTQEAQPSPDPINALLAVSVALILAGLALFGVRRIAARGNRPSDEPVSPTT